MKRPRDSERSGGDVLQRDAPRKKSSCFSNIKIFLIAECALMLAQGTVGAYLVSDPPASLPLSEPSGHFLKARQHVYDGVFSLGRRLPALSRVQL